MRRGRLVRATRYQVNMSLFLIWSVADTGLAQYTQLTCVPLPEFDISTVYIFDLLQGFTYLLCIGLRVGVVAITINANDYK